jgi:hypothetical protein
MTGIARLQHLPVPATAGTVAVATPDHAEDRQVKAVLPVTPTHRNGAEAERSARWARGTGRDQISDGSGGGEERRAAAGPLVGEAAGGRQISFSRLTSMSFVVQLLGQQSAPGRSQAAMPQTLLTGHRDAAVMGSELYRRSGGEPEILPDSATFVRLAV